MEESTLNGLLDFAIREERQANALYLRAAEMIADKGARTLLLDMAAMEKGHERKLADFREGRLPALKGVGKVRDLKIGDYLVDVKLRLNSTIQEVLIFAIKGEMKSQSLYSDMAAVLSDPVRQEFMKALSEEELKHKNDLETLYDDIINKEN
jgi:rubrerythrin